MNEETLTQPNAGHTAQLALCRSKVAKVRYACESLVRPSTSDVLAFLVAHGVVSDPARERSYVSTQVNKWRKERGQGDTDDVPPMSTEMLAAMDSLREQVDVSTNTPPAEPVSEHADTNTNAPAVTSEHEHANSAVAAVREHVNVPAERESEHANTSAVTSTNVRVLPTTEPEPSKQPRKRPRPALGFYAAAALAAGVSVDTSFRFFGEKLGIHGFAQLALFAVMEVALIACGYAMAQNVRAGNGPGPTRITAWGLCGFAVYAAIDLSGPVEGPARAALGPIMGLLMLHHALGIDKRAARDTSESSTWGRIGREYRERFLSRLGLADDGRDALVRTQERAARRAAHLARSGRFTPFRRARLSRNVRISNAAHDETQRTRMLAELAAVEHVDALGKLEQPSPWLRG